MHLPQDDNDPYSRRQGGRDFDMLDDEERDHYDRDEMGGMGSMSRHFLGGQMPTSLDGFSNDYRTNLAVYENKRIEGMSKYPF